MTDDKKHHYVYALFREDGITPFYIGVGVRSRIDVHEQRAHKAHSHKNHIIMEMKKKGISLPKCKLAEGLTRAEALEIEIDLIRILTNIGADCLSEPKHKFTSHTL